MLNAMPPFALDRWMDSTDAHASPYDLTSSTAPALRLSELLKGMSDADRVGLDSLPLAYSKALGDEALRAAIAARHAVASERVVVTHGASEALQLVFFTAAQSAGNVVIPAPCFPPTETLCHAYDLEVRRYALRRSTGYRLPVDDIARAIDRHTQLVVVNTPHNPTGSVVSDGELEAVQAVCWERGVDLVVDEVFHPLYGGAPSRSGCRLPGTIVLGSLSKAWGLSGLRVGWLIDAEGEAPDRYFDLRAYLSISSSPLVERLATAALARADSIVGRAEVIWRTNARIFAEFLERHDDLVGCVAPMGGTTAFPWLRREADARPLCERAAAAGVMIIPGDCFGEPAHFRVGLVNVGERFPEALERLSAVLRAGHSP
jgi:aspartate/methionine/tyrosine aminotransferase